jgi:hypothetical protein
LRQRLPVVAVPATAAQGEATEVIVTHEGISSATLRDRHLQGWDGCLDGLGNHLLAAS